MPFSRKTFVSLLILFSLFTGAMSVPARAVASNAPDAISVIDLTPISGELVAAYFMPDGRVLSRSNNFAFSNYFARSWIYENNTLRALTLGGDNCYAVSIGNQIIGSAEIPGGANRAFIYTGGQMRDLGTLPGRAHSRVRHVNDAGHVVGLAYNRSGPNQPETDERAFYYNGTTMLDLGTMPGTTRSFATAIDNSNRILGVSYNVDSGGYWVNAHAFLYVGGVMIDLTPVDTSFARAEFLPDGRILSSDGGTMSYGRTWVYENDTLSPVTLGNPPFVFTHFSNNQLYGGAKLENGLHRAYLYQNGVTHNLGVLPGMSESSSSGANAAGHVVGRSYNGEMQVDQRAFYHNGTQMIDLGVLPGFAGSYAVSIDANDRVLGVSSSIDGQGLSNAARAFLYNGASLIDLTPTNNRSAFARFLTDGRILSNANTSTMFTVIESHAWVYENNILHALTLGGANSDATESKGQVVGWAEIPGGARRGIIYLGNGVVRNVGTLPGRTESSVIAANAAGQVIGEAFNFDEYQNPLDHRAFYHNGTTIQEISPVAGTEFNTVTEIDNQNRIVGVSFNRVETGSQTNRHAYLAITGPTQQGRNHRFDFDGDGETETAVFRPSNGTWYAINSQNNSFSAQQFGANGDRIVPEDYDGDGKTDIAVFRPANGYWYITDSQSGAFRFQHFGATGDIPAPGDYDGDGKSDLAVFRPSTGTFYILNSSDGSFRFQAWGANGDVPLMGDYDGDGKTDLTVFRESAGAFYILKSSDNSFVSHQWGASGDKPVAGDFDGDGKADVAVFRPTTGAWYIKRSSDNGITGIGWGASGDLPVAGEYDGDGKWDIAIFRPSNGVWYILKSTNNSLRAEQFGLNGDAPAPAAFVP